jgi:hypothetical protein
MYRSLGIKNPVYCFLKLAWLSLKLW